MRRDELKLGPTFDGDGLGRVVVRTEDMGLSRGGYDGAVGIIQC